jgi:acetyl/propionyl-CoA carboxylase alpha subunit
MNTFDFDSVLVANRGEIAARILRTVRGLGLRALLVAHEIDGRTPALDLADDVRMISGASPVAAFLDAHQILFAARDMGAQAIHPGYGFLSENGDFARAVQDAGMTWVGPSPETIALMGDKVRARSFVGSRGFPLAPSAVEDDDPATFVARAHALGPPLLIKPSAGGGGKGMRIVRDLALFDEELARARSEGQRYFGDGRLFVERYIEAPRHIEVQVLGDAHGRVVHLFERECSLQRRFQKVIEEAPSPALSPELRDEICKTAVGIAQACHYVGAGTVEFIHGGGGFYFLEMNTRLQVEHPTTEMITGLDLVAEQLRVASGRSLSLTQQDIRRCGHAIEARVYAEDPSRDFAPTTGPILRLRAPTGEGVRFDAGVLEGARVTTAFDPMLAKLVVRGRDRNDALDRIGRALADLVVLGVITNVGYLTRLLSDQDVVAGRLHTGLIAEKPELASEPPLDQETLEALIATAALSSNDARTAIGEIGDMHAAMGGWRN